MDIKILLNFNDHFNDNVYYFLFGYYISFLVLTGVELWTGIFKFIS